VRIEMLGLFDVDGTLLRRIPPDQDGRRVSRKEEAFMRTVNRLWSVGEGFYTRVLGSNLEGMTDLRIILNMAGRMGIDTEDVQRRIEEVKSVLIEEFEKLVAEGDSTKEYEILPGVRDLLAELLARGVRLGIATGNLEYFARHKLIMFDLEDFFSFGCFGDNSFDRREIVKRALDRVSEDRAFLVGDTPADIDAGRYCDIGVIAVATGAHTMEQLKGYSPDLLIKSLTDRDRILEYLGL